MANITGARSTETWNNGDIITGNVTVAAGQVITVGATTSTQTGILVTSSGSPYTITISGTINCVGTVSNIKSFKSTTGASTIGYGGFVAGANSATLNFQYTLFENATTFLNYSTYTTLNLTLSYIWINNCSNGSFASSSANSNNYNNILVTNCSNASARFWSNSDTTITRAFFYNVRYTVFTGGGTTTHDQAVYLGGMATSSHGAYNTTASSAMVITNSYFKTDAASTGIFLNGTSTTLTATGNVVTNCGTGIGSTGTSATGALSYNDITQCRTGFSITAGTGSTMTSDYDYKADCSTGIGVSINTTGTSGTVTVTNGMSAPNRPLTTDNYSVGTPTANSVTITFDSTAGTTNYRLDVIPFIEYGTTAGVYTESTLNVKDLTTEDIGKAWIGIGTYSFAQTGHSITINNIKDSTTFYFRCCGIDPLGRIAYGVESSFTTTGLPAVPVFSGLTYLEPEGFGDLKVYWSAGTGTIDSYNVYARINSSPTVTDDTYLIARLPNTITSHVFNHLPNGTRIQDTDKVYVKVQAQNAGGMDTSNVSEYCYSLGSGVAGVKVMQGGVIPLYS